MPYWAIEQVMKAMHFSPKFVDNILELYQNTFTQFKTGFGYTDKVYLHSGVRQGDTISPTLFILSLAPLIHKIDRLNLQTLPSGSSQHVLTFADDTLLLTANATDTSLVYDTTALYATDFGIHVNAKKSGYAWTNGTPVESMAYNQEKIQRLGSNGCYKYLGIYINLELNFDTHFKILKMCYQSVAQAVTSLKGINIKNKVTLLNAVAAAILMYSMNVIVFPSGYLDKLNTWTANRIKWGIIGVLKSFHLTYVSSETDHPLQRSIVNSGFSHSLSCSYHPFW